MFYDVKTVDVQKVQTQILKGAPKEMRPGKVFLKQLRKARVGTNMKVSMASGATMFLPMFVATADNLPVTGSVMATFMGISGYTAISAYEGYRTKRDAALLACVAHRMEIDVTNPDALATLKMFAATALNADGKKRPGEVLMDSLRQVFAPRRTFEKKVQRVVDFKGPVRTYGL